MLPLLGIAVAYVAAAVIGAGVTELACRWWWTR